LNPEGITVAEAVEVGREWGAGAPLAPLILSFENCETDENIQRNLRATLESDYKPINSLITGVHDRTVSICGFGPSLKQTYKNLEGDVWACNGAHDWLIERGIVPKYAMFWDANEAIAKFANPHPDVTYLVASRCNRKVFEALEGYNVYVWHCGGDAHMDDLLCEYRKMEPMCGHGSAAVTTSMVLSSNLGYRNMRAFGADGSYEDGGFTHAKESIVPEKQLIVYVGGRRFTTTSWLAGQIEDFKIIGPLLKSQGCNIEFHGDGLLPYVASINNFKVHV
tara:strand:- start:3542 stop:4378 length:837 start_codon:yes stop_codon:yes gene_type:complete